MRLPPSGLSVSLAAVALALDQNGVDVVQETVKQSRVGKKVQFTALMHHITPQLLIDSFKKLKKSAAAGVDGVT